MLQRFKNFFGNIRKSFGKAFSDWELGDIFSFVWLATILCYAIFSGFVIVMIKFVWHLIAMFILTMFIWFACYCILESVEKRKKSRSNESFEVQNEDLDETHEQHDIFKDEKIRVYKNWRLSSNFEDGAFVSPYYLLETSTFFAMQEYTRRMGGSISDIVYGNIPLEESYEQLAEMIKQKRCYVSTEVYNEVVALEEKGALDPGTYIFIQEDMGIWPELNAKLDYEEFCMRFGKCKERYYKIILTANEIAKQRNSDVWIVTNSKRLSFLANEYATEYKVPIKFVSPAELEDDVI